MCVIIVAFLPCRMIHAFTCAGALPTQYIKLSRFAGIGSVKHGYISRGDFATIDIYTVLLIPKISVYNQYGYIEIVRESAERSMRAAVDEVKALPQYATSGEVWVLCFKETFLVHKIQWVITDARHDSTANAYHTTVPCLSGRFVSGNFDTV